MSASWDVQVLNKALLCCFGSSMESFRGGGVLFVVLFVEAAEAERVFLLGHMPIPFQVMVPSCWPGVPIHKSDDTISELFVQPHMSKRIPHPERRLLYSTSHRSDIHRIFLDAQWRGL